MKNPLPPVKLVFTMMRLSMLPFFLLTLSLGMSAPKDGRAQEPLTRPVSVDLVNEDLRTVLTRLEKAASVKFSFVPKLINAKDKISLSAQNEALSSVLNRLLSPRQIAFESSGKYIILTQAINPTAAESQKKGERESQPAEQTISGKIIDETGTTLPGVSVVLKGTRRGTTTNVDGAYSLVIPDGPGTLVFSYVGYLPQEVAVAGQTTLNITLKTDTKALGEVVVIGYGTRKKDELSGAVTQVNADIITKQPVISFDQALVGQVPGMTIREGSGAPGAGPEILVRGVNTFGSNKPLIVIDNVIFENYNDQNNNPLALLNPEDIENVSVLKDAATKAIYGSRATAGVIIVTTKRGRAGKPKLTFNASAGVSTPMAFEKPNMMNAQELAQFRKESAIDRVRFTNATYRDPTVAVPDNLLPAAFLNPEQYGVGTNWYDQITRTAGTQRYNLSINGGTDNVTYFISGNYLNQEGVVKFTDLQRISLRANIDLKLSPKFKTGLNLSPSRTTQNRPSNEPGAGGFSAYSNITTTYWASPEAKVYDDRGNFVLLTTSPLTTNWTANPLYRLQAETEERLANQLQLGTYLEYAPLPNLLLRTTLSYSDNIRRSRAFSPSTVANDGLTPIVPRVIGATATLYNENFSNLTLDNTITYRLLKNQHNLELLGGFSAQDVSTESSTINAQRLLDENLRLVSSGNVDRLSTANFTGGEGYTQNRLMSYFGRASYIYGNRYIVNLSVRRDASSRFGRNVQSAVFPAGSVAWKLSEEGFLKDRTGTWLDELRLEVGYGITGNQQGIGNYSFLGAVGQSNYLFGGVSTLGNALNVVPNADITWEQSRQFDFGINASLFKRRLNLSFNTYKQVTDGLLSFIPLPTITGFGGVQGNGGAVQNTGFEFQIDGDVVRRKNLAWNTSFNVSRYKNRILELTNGTFFSGTAGNGANITISEAGQPVGMYYGLQILGLFTAEDIANAAVPKYAGAAVGTIKYLDGNGNGVLEQQADHVVTGNPHPDLLFGWTNQIKAYGFSLRAIFAGQLGGAIMDLRKELMYNVDGNFNVHRDFLNRFRPGDDPTTKTFPTTVSGTAQFRWPNNTRLTDGSYVALKNLTLAYNVGTLLKRRTSFFNAAELFGSVQNVFYIANYKEGNPEIRRSNDGSAVRSVNYGSYPISRTSTLGLNLSF